MVPDVIVKQVDGELALALNDHQVPVLGVSPFFEQLSRSSGDRELKKFVNHNLQDARWFMRSIDERNRSLLKVTRAVVGAQREFFRRGAKHLVPLTLKDVAADVGVHEATVSRLANGKHLQTEFGIFELRYFFTNSISGAGSKGSRFSKTAVKEILREIIEDTAAAGTNGKPGREAAVRQPARRDPWPRKECASHGARSQSIARSWTSTARIDATENNIKEYFPHATGHQGGSFSLNEVQREHIDRRLERFSYAREYPVDLRLTLTREGSQYHVDGALHFRWVRPTT